METKPTPIRLPSDLLSEVEAATQFTGLSQQDVMRLAMRIGLVDLRAAKDIASVIQETATDKGTSFLAWAKQKQAADDAAAVLKKIPPRQFVTYAPQAKKNTRPRPGHGPSGPEIALLAEEHEK